MRKDKGATLIELIVIIVIVGIVATAFTTSVIPLFNSLFYFPQSTRISNAAADAMDIILEGDNLAKGLRYAGPGCTIGGGGGGGSTITGATASSITYNYIDSDYCGGTAARTSHTVTISYDSGSHTITRAIDGGAASNIPYYAVTGSNIALDPPTGQNMFRYFNDQLSEMLGVGINVLAIYRVDVSIAATSGSGQVKDSAGQSQIKSSVDIRRYVPAPTPCLLNGSVCVTHSDCCVGSCT